MLASAARFFVYSALAAPLIIATNLFFPFITGKALVLRGAIELGLFFYLLHVLFLSKDARREELRWLRALFAHPVLRAVLAFGAVFVISSLTSARPHFSFWSNFERAEGGFQMIHYVLFFSLLPILFRIQKDWLRLCKFSVVIAAIVGMYAVGQFFAFKCIDTPPESSPWYRTHSGFCSNIFSIDQNGNDILKTNADGTKTSAGAFGRNSFVAASSRPSGTLGNSDYLAPYMLFAAFFAAFVAFTERNRFKKWLWVCLLLFFIGMIGLANSRTTIFAAFVGTLLLLGYAAAALWRMHPLRARAALALLLILVGSAVFFGFTSRAAFWDRVPILERLRPHEILQSNSLNTRLWTWGSAIAAVKERPILGWGAEVFPVAFDKYYDVRHYGIESWYDRAHNIFLDYAVSGGILLLLAYLAIFAYTWITAFRRDDPWLKIAAVWFLMYLVQGMTIFDVLPVYLQFFILAGFFVSRSEHHEAKKKMNAPYVFSSWRLAGLGVIIAVLVLLFIVTIFHPFQKNKLLLAALLGSPKDLGQSFGYFERALTYPSVIGQSEAVEAYLRFWNETLNNATLQGIQIAPTAAESISQQTRKIVEENKSQFISSRPLWTAGIIHIQLAQLTRDARYLQGAHMYCEEGLGRAPVRIEFLSCLYQIAVLENDAESAARIGETIGLLRPDLIGTSAQTN